MKIFSDDYKDITNYINVIQNAISHDVCDNIVLEFLNCDDWVDSIIASGKNSNIRKSKEIDISVIDIIQKNYQVRKKIDNEIFHVISKIFNNLRSKYINLNIKNDTGYTLLKYSPGDFYSQHTDYFEKEYRSISCSLCLNDNYEGGEFAFFNRNLKFKLEKGSAIIFPSNFMYPHEIMPIIKGTRYSIVTWFQ